ncbi:LacI family DNA-binding transcriptional regulator [Sulfitobacter mediterraneus]|uniref:LacI family DNA-binding transcriptional regulator n=1 Tax=Sulfitobacter mediterraneus TaxID=83219 RepID=UPI00193A7E80|nr:LacI family DNA-binding transcriptional regulator [Sulfitobacter mediterraneus]MBM1557468.1 LacI family DNA-binding transcriptional regulator [Sulfitobacter mediterraneus]MBM1568514.1 LacI family DNA-binding transcriptional regulator [Sulfitobacter mediterraneus]MBM1571883.1 LacI family DNA-binding transcriptional regulator [Sulfitobacter mediterraneus]MBM1575672.1 LacI family DNA-binding transcriptional regulator [Sulfitobacter mediterraneus]MBM1579994.1 LacI family DNA-binding transcripti
MAQNKVTSAEVAARAGVSQSAVSRVFTPGASASAKTVEKVRTAAAELGYRPNVLARAMVSGRSRIIGLVVAYLENQFYPVALELLSNALQAKGYHILIFTAPNSTDGIDSVLQDLMDYQVDGIVAASVSMSSDLAARARSAGIPVVLFNRGQDGEGFSNVTSDNVLGGAKVAEFLMAGGHERIAHIAGWQGSSTGRDRQEGFVTALEKAGVEPFDVLEGMYKRDVAMAAARSLVDRPDPADAIFVGNDHMAFAVMDAVRDAGMTPGRDISIVGYDDVPMASWGSYDLTTLRQPVNRMVDATVETLIDQIEKPAGKPGLFEIEGELIVRSSARIPEGWTQ